MTLVHLKSETHYQALKPLKFRKLPAKKQSEVQGLNTAQSQMQMGMWAVLAAPLLMSNDLRNLSSSARSILLNKEAIAINQDPLGMCLTCYQL